MNKVKQQTLQCGRYRLSMSHGQRPLVMGILNVTPDSFSDGGQHMNLEFALEHAEQMIADGVDIIDIGGESTKPGAAPVSLEDELKRVMPLVYALKDCGKPLSVDTYKPQVMKEVLLAGADMINDINGFKASGAIEAVKNAKAGLCVMHMKGQPSTMQEMPQYQHVVEEVSVFLQKRINEMLAAGISHDQICIDPGFGFGKTAEHNYELLRYTKQFIEQFNMPLLAGMSRKSMIGDITHKPIEKRLAGSLGAAIAAAAQGAMIIRVHDVAETVDALNVWYEGMSDALLPF